MDNLVRFGRILVNSDSEGMKTAFVFGRDIFCLREKNVKWKEISEAVGNGMTRWVSLTVAHALLTPCS